MNLSRAGIAGIILAGLGIGLFLLVFFGLQNLGVGDFPSLMLALCIPPAAMAAIIGIYLLSTARKNPNDLN